ncbi:MAG: enoyl-CoA hydratase-related protein [Pseudomonadota bacterium]
MSNPDSSPVLLTRNGAVAQIQFNRPQQLNTLDVATAQAFLAVCQTVQADSSVRAVVISGAGRGFGAGGDLASFKTDPSATAVAVIEPMHAAIKILTSLDAPVIASLHGVVAGGSLSLAMACDLAIAAEGTKFNLAYANVAANCDVSGSWHLPRLVGLRNAMQIALLCDTFLADEALRLGLVNRVVPADQLAAETEKLAQRLANGPTLALGKLKKLLRASLNNDLATQLDLERDAFRASTATRDFGEALDAFFNKRPPLFEGR